MMFAYRRFLLAALVAAGLLIVPGTAGATDACTPDDMNWCPPPHLSTVAGDSGAPGDDDMHW